MFRKKLKFKSGHTQSTKNRQTLIQMMSENYPIDIAEDVIKSFPNLEKRHIEGSGIFTYFYEKNPIFFTEGSGKGIYPTCKFYYYQSVHNLFKTRIV